MVIVFECKCGKKLKTRPELAGKSIKCPGCGQVVKVPIPEKKPEEELDLLPLEELPKSSPPPRPPVAPTVKQSPAAKGNIPANAEPPPAASGNHCPKCGNTVYAGDVICLRCGEQLGKLKGRAQRKFTFFQQRLVRFGMAVLLIVLIGIIVYVKVLSPSSDGISTNHMSPKEKLLKELNKDQPSDITALGEDLALISGDPWKMLLDEMNTGGGAKKPQNILQAMVILAYYGRFNQPSIYYGLSRGARGRDTVSKVLLVDLFYLISTPDPDYTLIEHNEEIKKCRENFTTESKNQLVPAAETTAVIIKFTTDEDELVRLKSLAVMASQGDTSRLDQIAKLLDSKDNAITSKASALLFRFTGQVVTEFGGWIPWWDTNKNRKPASWFVSGLRLVKGNQRRFIIERLIKLTGQNFQYPENALEEDQDKVITQWEEWLKNQPK